MCGAGVRYFNECPLNHWIPTQLIICGAFLLCVVSVGFVLACVSKFFDGEPKGLTGACMIGEALVCCIVLLWTFAGEFCLYLSLSVSLCQPTERANNYASPKSTVAVDIVRWSLQ